MNIMKNNHTNTLQQSYEKGRNPYKALEAYEEVDRNIFLGREEETEKLFQLVKQNCFTVVYGKPGSGKTSLLNAGLFPRLRGENFLPIPIRLNFSKDASPLKEQICRAFNAELNPNEVNKNQVELESKINTISPDPISGEETLWEYFRRVNHLFYSEGNEKVILTPVLVFDQFEEIFTIGKDHEGRDRIIYELYWLLGEPLPPEIKYRTESNPRIILNPGEELDFKLILCIKEDYLINLRDLTRLIPSNNPSLFPVMYLNEKQASDIISETENGLKEEETIRNILHLFFPKLDTIEKDIPADKWMIKPNLLSVMGYLMFEGQLLKSIKKREPDKLLEDYYDLEIKEYPPHVHEFIESNLITAEGFRTPLYLVNKHPLKKFIDRLVKQKILRKFYDGDKQFVEIVHDSLLPVIKERGSLIKRKKSKSVISSVLQIIGLLCLISVFAIYQMCSAVKQYKIADRQRKIAEVNRLTAESLLALNEDNTKAIRIAEEAIKKSGDNPLTGPFKVLSKIGYSSYNNPFYIALYHLNPKDAIYSAVFSSDNQYILTAHEDGTFHIQDLMGNPVLKLIGHSGRIISAVFSPDVADENLILTASWDNTARLWNMEGKQRMEFNHDRALTCASFSPDGKQILTASLDNTARLWNLQGKQLQEFKHQGRVISAVFSPDGNRILTASWDKTSKLWDREGTMLADLNRHNNILSSAVFSPDGRYILTGSRDETALLWNDKGEVLATFKHDSAIVAALFSPDGKLILTADLDGNVKLWHQESLELKTSIKHEGTLSIVAFAPDGNLILTASEDGAAKMWDLQGNRVDRFNKHTQKITAAAFAANGNYLFTASGGELSILWDLQPNIVVDLKHSNQVSKAIFPPDEKSNLILTIAEDGIARLWDNKGKFLASFRHGKIIKALFSPAVDFILTASNDGAIKRWDVKGKCTNTLETNIKPLTRVFFPEDGSKIFPLSNSNVANVLNFQGEIIKKIQHDEFISEAIFSPNGENLITVSSGDKNNPDYKGDVVKLWNLSNSNDNNSILSFNQENIAAVVFSPNNNFILTASQTGETIVRNLSGEIQHRLNLAKKNRELIFANFSPDSKRIITILGEGPVVLWDLNGAPLVEFKHDQVIYTAAFSRQGKNVLTASLDKTAKLWDMSGNLLATFQHGGAVFSAAFSPDGSRVVTASRDATAKVWLTPSAILQWLENSGIPHLSEDDKKELKISPNK
jgi:WD40 repeat protein